MEVKNTEFNLFKKKDFEEYLKWFENVSLNQQLVLIESNDKWLIPFNS